MSTSAHSADEASAARALPDPEDGLRLIKGSVKSQAAYTLEAPVAARKLNQNENPLDLPAELKAQILARAARLAWNRYPEFVPVPLVEGIARLWSWIPEGVLVGNGSNELIQATLTVSLDTGGVVVAPAPTFALYRLIAATLGARYVPVPLGERFAYDIDAIISTARREDAGVVVLNSPNNPTGSALPAGAVERVLEETGALVVCDEAYQEFGGPTAMELLRRSSRIVVLRTFSKAMGMAGLRFGYALAHPAVAREIAKAKLPYNVNAFTLAAATMVLEHPAPFKERTRAIIAEREKTAERLRGLPGLTVFPSAANFILIRSERLPASVLFRRLHAEHGILVRDVSSGAGLAECLRISIGTSEDMDAVIVALRQILASVVEASR
ncbi:MAG: histidinol-phosphate transaminase [Gemmatimonadota bacterium]